jgi:phosphate transport system permease protein
MTIVFTLTIMVLPTITLITTTSINSVDRKMEHSSLALGASRAQTSFLVTLKAATPGILVAVILGVGRVMGEATAVSMVSTPSYYGPSFGLFEQIRLLTATMLSGRKEMTPDSLQESMMISMAMLLLLSILVVFIVMK